MGTTTTKIADVIDRDALGQIVTATFTDKSVLVASGVVSVDENSEIKKGGQKLLIPRTKLGFGTWQAMSETSPIELRKMELESEYGVVVRRADGVAILETAQMVAGDMIDLMNEAGRQVSEAVGQNVDSTLLKVLAGAVPSANIVTQKSGNLAVSDFSYLRAKLGDQYDKIALYVIHSKQFFDLELANAVTYFAATDVFPGSKLTGMIPTIGGKPVYVTDKVPAGTSPTTYRAFALGKNSMYLGYQSSGVQIRTDEDATQFEDILTYSLHFVPHLLGMSWNSTGMPSDANLIDTTKWSLVAPSAKLVPATSIITL